MAATGRKNASAWLEEARKFYAQKNWIGALSSVRNALRVEVNNLQAWALGSEILMLQDRQHLSGRYAKALRRFALKAAARKESEFAERRIAEVDIYFANYHKLWGKTDLTHFAANGDSKKVRELLESGVDPNERDSTGWTALHSLQSDNAGEMAKLLVAHGANLEAENLLKETPLLTACRFERKNLIPVLLELGANVRHVAKGKHTALWYAISSMKDVETVKLLIDAGADANETYPYGDNPFLLAVYAQKPEVVNYLLPLTKDVARMDKHQVCAIDFAASYNDTDLIERLLARGVSAEQANNYGRTPLMSAAENGSVAAAKMLLAHGAAPHRKNESGDSAITLAERRENAEIYELLIQGGTLDRRQD